MDQFTTRSSGKRSMITVGLTGLVCCAAAFWGLTVTVAMWLFLEGMILLSIAFCLFLTARSYFILEFTNDRLILTNNGNRQQYLFQDLTLADFHIRQSEAQKKHNTCDLQIEDSIFRITDLENHNELLAYLQTHYR
jgi:hypothetical protein